MVEYLGVCGEFGLLERIGGGGMAEIFLAHPKGSRDPREIFVVKWARPHVAQDENLSMNMRDESRITRTLDHPNIAKVHGYGEQGGRVFVVMDYIHGKDLRAIQHRAPQVGRPVPYWVSAYVMARVAEALDHVHSCTDSKDSPLNIIHRDVNPHNVMVTYDGVPKLIDFGIAKAAGRHADTHVGQVKGKSAYMSPEQARGLGLDSRSDIFSAGLVLFELVTGRRAYRGGDEDSLILAAGNADVPSAKTINPDTPDELVAILARCLQFRRKKRFSRGNDLRDALDGYLEREAQVDSKHVLANFMAAFFDDEAHQEASKIRQLMS